MPHLSSLLFLVGVILVLITPGPTNTLLAAAGLCSGLRRAAPLVLAEAAGYGVSITAWGCIFAHAAGWLNGLPFVLRAASIVYVAVLAIQMWRTAGASPDSPQARVAMKPLFAATVLNPKAMLFATTLFPAGAFEGLASYAKAMSLFTVVLVPIGLLWIAFGAALGAGGPTWLNARRVQRGAAVMLGLFAVVLSSHLFR
ncbi:LysE family transporter [Caballeronia sp. LZ001]|uniref:LysE family translocator n=1 Tax=Caballeronia sp. LZ001 TaxID=3038553 RepID=UPI00285B25CB|nr:LysE family transporter [Caballeronia sp. LZ001]MDR5801404.1 LysE family transporter [Caballeronia sp. LZ001]